MPPCARLSCNCFILEVPSEDHSIGRRFNSTSGCEVETGLPYGFRPGRDPVALELMNIALQSTPPNEAGVLQTHPSELYFLIHGGQSDAIGP
jgi:hypothetical protein